jgi:hypothetical protein
MQVEKVSDDVLMTWRGAHCGLAPAYFADEPAAPPSDWVVSQGAPEHESLERVERRVEEAMIEAT